MRTRPTAARRSRLQISEATTGIGHTRWATHGKPSERNAHPHPDCTDRVHIVLNGIIENYVELRAQLESEGHHFSSETDAEAVAHLIEKHLEVVGADNLPEATRLAYLELRGHYAFVAVSADDPDTIVGARKDCPLVIGVGEGEHFVASAIPAFLRETRNVQLVNDDEVVTVRRGGVEFRSAAGELVSREVEEITWDEEAAEKSGYPTFMLKEIHEQSDAVAETIADRLAHDETVDLSDIGITDDELATCRRIVIVACGTSYHAGLVGRYAIEKWARVPVEMDIASEYRYRDPVIGPDDLVIGISQSGETADTLAAMRLARSRGAKVLAVTNILGSQATRDADGVLYTRAGLEIGVAATKTFVAQVAAMYLIGLKLAELRHTMDPAELHGLIGELKAIPHRIEMLVKQCEPQIRAIARTHSERDFFLYLGPPHRPADRTRGRTEAEGDLLHPDGGLRRRRDEAWADRAARQLRSCRVHRHGQPRARQGALQRRGGQGSRRRGDRGRDRGVRPRRCGCRPDRLHPAHRLDPPADPGGRPAPAAGVPHRPPARPERGSAAQPREDRNRRVNPERPRRCRANLGGMTKRKTWVLDTGTKGTGAEMVPLEKVLRKPGPGRSPPWSRKRRERLLAS